MWAGFGRYRREENTKEDLEGKSIDELLEMQKTCLNRMAENLCELIICEIEGNGTKKRIRTWLKSLRNLRADLLAIDGVSLEILATIENAEQEAEGFLLIPKR